MKLEVVFIAFVVICGQNTNVKAKSQTNSDLENTKHNITYEDTIESNGHVVRSLFNIINKERDSNDNETRTTSLRRDFKKSVNQTTENEIINTQNHKSSKLRRRITPIVFMVPELTEESENDVCSDSSEDFPTIFTNQQLANGAVAVCFLIGIYCFTFLAVVCDKYFLPCVEILCEALNLPQDVAGATFMSMATSAPEFFVNIVGTFITESDIGIGTVVGSNLYNTLGVAALGSLAASSPIQLDWWPVTRDCLIYICAVTLLVGISWDGNVYWYEGLIMVIAFCVYLLVQFNSRRLAKCLKKCIARRKSSTDKGLSSNDISVTTHSSLETVVVTKDLLAINPKVDNYKDCDKDSEVSDSESLWKMPKGNCWSKIFFIYLWPIKALLCCIVPNPKAAPKLFPLTFILCVILIGLNSYIVSWMLTLIGTTFKIPDAILGLTFLAAGGGLPESISIIIMSRRGEGSIGVSNALGANSVNILMSLGFPWFISTLIMGTDENSYIQIASGSIHYTILALLLVVCSLFLTLYFNKFRLSRLIGVVLSIVYLAFLTLAILSEVFFVHTESC